MEGEEVKEKEMATNTCFGGIMEEGGKLGFYKILRKKAMSSETMRSIPHDLINSIPSNELMDNMVLKLPWGSSWPLKISKNTMFHYMEKSGWDRFLSDNGLGQDEFVTFIHIGNMCFSVNIYQIDCIEMLTPRKSTFASPSLNKTVKKEEKVSLSKSSNTVSEAAESSTRRGRMKRQPNLGKKKVKEEETLVPEVKITIRKSYLLFLGIPKKFSDMHMPMERTKFKIHYLKENNKSWEVTYVVSGIQSRFAAGWHRLAKELGLVVGDVCTFKLIKPAEMLLVNISR